MITKKSDYQTNEAKSLPNRHSLDRTLQLNILLAGSKTNFEILNPHFHKNFGQTRTSFTGKSLSEALIFPSTNPQYDNIFFIELQVQCVKIPSSEHGENMLCTEIDFDIQNNLCTQHVLPHVLQK